MSIFRYPLGLLLILGIAAHASVLWQHFTAMWDSNSFRFFPLAIVIAIFVAYYRQDRLVPSVPSVEGESEESVLSLPKSPVNGSVVAVGMALSVIGAFLTSIMATPTLGWMSFLLFLCVVIYAGYGNQGIKAMWPSLVILAMFRFIPDSTDRYVVMVLQKVASLLASVFMDGLGWIHVREGAMLSVASAKLEVLEACSGIRSLFSSLTVIFAWGIVRSYGPLRHVFNLLQTFFWVIVFNALRVVLIWLFHSRGWVSMTEGLPLEIITTVIFLMILAMALSTDQLITAFTLKEGLVDAENPRSLRVARTADSSWKWSLGSSFAIAWMVGLGLATVVSLRMLMSFSTIASGTVTFPVPTKELLGPQIDGWVVTDFSHIERFNKHLLGENTYQWTLRKGKKQALLSLDQAATQMEDPDLHFSSLGWSATFVDTDKTPTVKDQPLTPVADKKNDQEKADPAVDNPATEEVTAPNEDGLSGAYRQLAISKRGGASGVVLFAKIGASGELLSVPETVDGFSVDFLLQRLRDGIATLLGNNNAANDSPFGKSSASRMLRLTSIPNVEVKAEDIKELKKLLVASEETLRKSSLFEAGK
ncbi:MAG: archaeosortase/exosortase family protein [Planctomycetota bacterium]|nr:archaeosortase/exosortase family protein [Planctomycetota bacterium]